MMILSNNDSKKKKCFLIFFFLIVGTIKKNFGYGFTNVQYLKKNAYYDKSLTYKRKL